jgi:hypothetical protein
MQLSALDDGRKHRPKHVQLTWNNKLIYTVHLVGYFYSCTLILSLRRADHSSKGVLPTVVRRCVWSRNLKNEEAMTALGRSATAKKNSTLYSQCFECNIAWRRTKSAETCRRKKYLTSKHTIKEFILVLFNVNQQKAHFPNSCFNSTLGVFYMFRTSWCPSSERTLYMQFCMVCFSYIYVSSLAGEVCTRFVGLHYIIASQCTVQRHKVLYTSVYSDKIIRNTKIKVIGLYWERSDIDGCQEMEKESRREICMDIILTGSQVKLWGPCDNKEKEEKY